MYQLTIPAEPRTKKNSARIHKRANGTHFIAPSAAYKEYEAFAIKWYLAAYPLGSKLNISTPVNVKCLFYMATRRRVDLVNLLEAADDILVKAGILADDNSKIIVSHDGSRVLYDKELPRTEIFITDLEEGENE